MKILRPANERGHFDHGWLDTYHSFSFGEYRDPAHMGFRVLRVINEDRVAPGQGFGTHPHADMEIITYIVSGGLEHRDSLGTGSVITPGELQVMSAGTGITHSEFNPSADEPVHLYQIWLRPAERGMPPRYDQKMFPLADRHNKLCVVASPDGADGSLVIGQDARLLAATIDAGTAIDFPIASGRHAWLQIVRGSLECGDTTMAAGDGLAISDESSLQPKAIQESELLLFDLP